MFKWLNYLDHIDSATRDDNAPDTVTLLVSMSDKRALRADTAPFHIPLLILSNFEKLHHFEKLISLFGQHPRAIRGSRSTSNHKSTRKFLQNYF